MKLVDYVRMLRQSPSAREELLVRLLRLHPLLKVIATDSDGLYLVRHYILHVLRNRLPGVYLHFINRSDADRELHNHPWETAASIILWGGYVETRASIRDSTVAALRYNDQPRPWLVEHVVPKKRIYRAGDLNVIRKNDFHRLELTSRFTVTLFVAGHRAQEEWGFVDLATGRFETEGQREARLERARRDGPSWSDGRKDSCAGG